MSKGRERGLFRRFIEEEEGQGTVEYILLLAFIVMGVGAFLSLFIGAFDRGLLVIGGALEGNLESGRMPLDQWNDIQRQ
jgi:Flp pilus assembly pilin Flp